jgi:hypothetical protein
MRCSLAQSRHNDAREEQMLATLLALIVIGPPARKRAGLGFQW